MAGRRRGSSRTKSPPPCRPSPRRRRPLPARARPRNRRRPRPPRRRTEATAVALLSRVLQRGPRSPAPLQDERMSVIEHLEALRRALIISLIAWSAATVAAIFIAGRVITFLITPAGLGHAIYFQPG